MQDDFHCHIILLFFPQSMNECAEETLTEEEISQWCKEKLAAYKVPEMIEFVEALPKSAIGKILRREVKEMDKRKREASKAK